MFHKINLHSLTILSIFYVFYQSNEKKIVFSSHILPRGHANHAFKCMTCFLGLISMQICLQFFVIKYFGHEEIKGRRYIVGFLSNPLVETKIPNEEA